MSWARSRVRRIRDFGRVAIWIALTGVAVVTAVVFWADELGYVGLAVVGGIVLAGLTASVLMPEAWWTMATGGTPLADQLGALQEKGLALSDSHPKVADGDDPAAIDAWRSATEEWANEVADLLKRKAPRWKGVFLTSPGGIHFSGEPCTEWNRVNNWRLDRLTQLTKIVAALEPK